MIIKLISCATLLITSAAWEKEAHESVTMTAMSGLKAKASSEIKRILDGRDIVEFSDWGHLVTIQYPETHRLFRQSQAGGECLYNPNPPPALCPDNACLIQAIKYFYGQLVDAPRRAGTDSRFQNLDLKLPINKGLTDADKLKFLITLMSEFANPLHLGFTNNNNGKDITVTYRNKDFNLYSFWETELIKTIILEEAGSWYGGWTHVNTRKEKYIRDQNTFNEKGMEAIDIWAQETLTTLCTQILYDPRTKLPIENGTVITPALKQEWTTLIKDQILITGGRLAILLNNIFEMKPIGTIKTGTVLNNVEQIQNANRIKKTNTFSIDTMIKNFAINILIFCGVAGIFIFIERNTLFPKNLHSTTIQNANKSS